MVVPPPIGTLDRIYFVVVVAGALSSKIVAVVAPPVPTFSVIAIVGAAVVPVVVATMKGPNMARGGVNSLFKNSTNSLEQVVSK